MLVARRLEEILIAVPKSKYDGVVARLTSESILHIEEPLRELPGGLSSRFKVGLMQASERVARINSYFSAIGLEPSLEQGLEIEVKDWVSSFNDHVSFYSDVDRFFEVRVSRLSELEARVAELQRLREVIEPFKSVSEDIRVAYESTRAQLALGTAPRDIEPEVYNLVERYGIIASIEELDDKTVIVGIAGKPGIMRSVVTTLVKKGFNLLVIPRELPGSPAEAYKVITSSIEKMIGEAKTIRGELLKRVEGLRRYYTYMYAYREAFRIMSSTLESGTTAFIRGYVDRGDVERLARILNEETRGAFIMYKLGMRRGEVKVPTKVSLPGVLKPFHKIVQLYGEPDPEEIIPTVFLAITFPLAFALMFPDLGHGLVLLLFAQLYLKRRSPDWAFILTVLGSAAMITGLLAGEFFGPLPAELLGIAAIWEKLGMHAPPLALPTYAVEHGLTELVGELFLRAISISLWMAAFMLILGTLLGVVDAYLKREYEELIAVKAPKFIFFTAVTLPFLVYFDATKAGSTLSAAILSLGGGNPMATLILALGAIAIAWMFLGEPIINAIHGHSPLSGLSRGFMEAYESILMAIGNIPSFLRIMALAMAHSSIMLGFAFIFEMMAHSGFIGLTLGLIVYIIGNLMVIGLEGILAFAHTLRLHFYEWFSKFYIGGGTPFTPISLPEVRIIYTGRV